MEVLYPRCAGLDVHKETVVAGVRLAAAGPVQTEVRRFDTTTPGLLALSAWLAGGVRLHPCHDGGDRHLLEAGLAHPRRRRHNPDSGQQASHVQRIQKTLEDANLKLGSVLTQIMGMSGRAILQALIDGKRDPDKLLALVRRGVKAPPDKLRAALQGRVTERHRFLLRLHLRQVDALAATIAEVDRDLDPFRQTVRLLRSIPGVSDLTAQVIVSEIGTDMSRFPTAGHLISWAGLCPRNDESAGKRRSTRLRKGAPWLRSSSA